VLLKTSSFNESNSSKKQFAILPDEEEEEEANISMTGTI